MGSEAFPNDRIEVRIDKTHWGMVQDEVHLRGQDGVEMQQRDITEMMMLT
jgi:hypothetical protein